ncbi:hypothetical protein [Paenibacillus hamazuiensis]|uniref:hypothetical protein n=1 Tax=Paenibacillus hamazuiensis TaxID=2936508 RepID=UPI00200C065B|nr:hypothetical protein [Paenibacillus hamazuiensis]
MRSKPFKMLRTVAAAVILFGFTAASTGAVPETVSAAAGESTAAARLDLWTPSHVDAPQIPLTFIYATGKAGTVTVDLLVKPEGAGEYRKASLEGGTSFETAGDQSKFTIYWNKEKDAIPPGTSVDLRLTATDADGGETGYDLNRLRLERRDAVRNHIDNYLIYYGQWTDSLIEQAREKYRMVILDTRTGITPEQIAKLRAGKDPHDASDDVLVLGYVSLGEDLRTEGMTPEQMKQDARFVLDGTGPSTDPRPGAPFPKGAPISQDINLKGKPTNGGYAPFYLNDNFATFGTIGNAGEPDFNTNFKAAFVNPGHPEWFKVLREMTLQADHVSGIDELLTVYGCDGLFMDTLDTAAPNSFTDASSSNQGQFEWLPRGSDSLWRTSGRRTRTGFCWRIGGCFYTIRICLPTPII